MRPKPIMTPKFLVLPSWLPLLLAAIVGLATCSDAKTNGTKSILKPELAQVFKQLSGVDTPIWRPDLGGQNFTACCLKAINEAITVNVNGSLVFAHDNYTSWITFNDNTTSLDALKDYDAQGQFPCTAAYNGNADGAPMVQVTYQWLSDYCPGWQISSKDNLNAWLQPLSSFLIPAIVFCISVPRRRKLELPEVLFSSDLSDVTGYFFLPVGVLTALVLVTADTLVWLCLCFAFSGPMIVSGLYEAMLDNRVIDYVKGKINEKQLTLDMRCRCLMLVLIGNLDLAWNTKINGYVDGGPVDSGAVEGTQDQAQESLLGDIGNSRHESNEPREKPPASPWQHMEQFLYDLRLYPDEITSRDHSPRQNPYPSEEHAGDQNHGRTLIYRHPYTIRLIQQVKTRLITMLHCQYSFGSVIGAPVVFYLGGLVFALLQSLDILGDGDIAEGLAFGQWYMTIPHIAIVSGLLLAGNNPNILEGVLAVDRQTYRADEPKPYPYYGLAYPSCYRAASLWDRGPNKKKWLETLIETYSINKFDDEDKDIHDLEKVTTLSIRDWIILLLLAFSLLGVPFVLAFLTAFYTPEIGLSCRSMTFLIYFCVQTMQIWLWIWAHAIIKLPQLESRRPKVKNHGWFGFGGRLYKCDFYKPFSTDWLYDKEFSPTPRKFWKDICRHPERMWSLGFLWNLMYYPSQYILGLVGIMAAIGGTLMQLMGVYSAGICYITTEYWFLPYSQRGMALLSRNSAEMIENAQKFWTPFAIAGISFMSLVSFIGWWYQRHMRDLFAQQVLLIDKEIYDRKDTETSRGDGAALYGTDKFDSRLVSLSAFNARADAASNMHNPSPSPHQPSGSTSE